MYYGCFLSVITFEVYSPKVEPSEILINKDPFRKACALTEYCKKIISINMKKKQKGKEFFSCDVF